MNIQNDGLGLDNVPEDLICKRITFKQLTILCNIWFQISKYENINSEEDAVKSVKDTTAGRGVDHD